MGTKYNKISSHEPNYKNNIRKSSNNTNNVTSTSNLLIVALIALIAFVMLIITLTSITDVFTDKTQQVPAMLIKTTALKSKDIVVGVNSVATPSKSNSAASTVTVTPTHNSYTNNKSFGNEVVSMTARGDNSELYSADGHNGFYDKINTSNKRNEFNSIPRRNLIKSTSSGESLFFEGVELQESLLPSNHKELLPHRNKRYLLFPESSSFQMIFDLIIGVVDYSSFAILGITCAVAWELPSKPPSDILEDIQLKLNDGTLGISRRNDSTQQALEFVETQAAVNEIQNANKAKVSATVDAGAVRPAEAMATVYEKSERKPMVTASSYNYNFNNHDYGLLSSKPGVVGKDAGDTLATHRNAYRPYNYFYAGDKFGNNDGVVGAGKSGSKTFRPAYAAQLGTHSYYNQNNNNNNNNNNFVGHHNGVTSTSGYLNGDRKKFVDWNRKAAWYEHKYKYPQQQQQQQQQPAKFAVRNNYANDNWWQHNKQRVQSSWQRKQQQWDQNVEEQSTSQLLSPMATPTAPVQTTPRTARNRQILQATPKHRIYPVFGKRRKRRSNDPITEFELKMERVHRREHLQTRQKLYGKIEKLFKVRGHNGTECVMRALCETAARSQHDAPQSFISELLRAIFTMPHDLHQHQHTAEAYELSAHYREAHAVAADCAARYALCEHSIWSDLEFGLQL